MPRNSSDGSAADPGSGPAVHYAPLEGNRRLDWPVLGIVALVTVRLLFHAVFSPAFDGPDEPYHLGRIAAFADLPFELALRGVDLDGRIVGAVRARPCGTSFGCPPFGNKPAAFNLLRPAGAELSATPIRNPENNQPPLFYMLAAVPIQLAHVDDPSLRLLAVRVLNVLLAGIGLALLLTLPGRRERLAFALAAGAAIVLPGAAESLARCANDAVVFLWAAILLVVLRRPIAPARTLAAIALLAAGPLLKLTAFPVVAFAVVVLWSESGRRLRAALAVLASLVVFPLQFWRGWRWGGTYELNRPTAALLESPVESLVGFARSAYTFAKTTFWLGGWSFFRAPLLLVIAFFALVAGTWLLSKRRPDPPRPLAHLAGLAGAVLGFALFAIANRRFFGGWGGVGGWYAWSWFPWLATAARDTRTFPAPARRLLLPAWTVFAVVANALYYRKAWGIYG